MRSRLKTKHKVRNRPMRVKSLIDAIVENNSSAPCDVVANGIKALKPDSDPAGSGGRWTPFHVSLAFKGPLNQKIASFLKKCNWMVVPHDDEYMDLRRGNSWPSNFKVEDIVEIVPLYTGSGDASINNDNKTFHITPTSNEKAILSQGLSGKFMINGQEWKGYPRTFLFVAKSTISLAKEALTVNEMLWRNYPKDGTLDLIKYGFTLLEVDSSGLELFFDQNAPDGYWVHTPNAVSPEKLRVVSRTGPINFNFNGDNDSSILGYPQKDLASVF
jgi:hypothetical protein